MNAEEFVKAFHTEKKNFLNEYLADKTESEVGLMIKTLNLNNEQSEILKRILNSSFTDIFYTILLGLDGNASIGGIQQMYQLKDEKGNQISGKIEGYAFEYFQESE